MNSGKITWDDKASSLDSGIVKAILNSNTQESSKTLDNNQ
jgi:hypothetical protein